jgi:hypothetical protein
MGLQIVIRLLGALAVASFLSPAYAQFNPACEIPFKQIATKDLPAPTATAQTTDPKSRRISGHQ